MSKPRYSPSTLPAIDRESQTRSFESTIQPGAVLEITFFPLDSLDSARMRSKANEAIAMYITGESELCFDDKPLEIPGLSPDEQRRITPEVIQNAAALDVMQPIDGNDNVSLESFLLIACRDIEMWENLTLFGMVINDEKKGKIEKESNPTS